MSVPASAASSNSSQGAAYSGQGAPAAGAKASPAAAGGEGVDFKEAFQSTRGELEKTKGQLLSMGRQFEGFKQETTKKTSVLDKLQRVLSGEEEKKPDPSQQWEDKIDFFLQKAVEADRDGSPIPLTAQLAADMYQGRIQAERESAQLKEQLAKMQQALDGMQNPTRQLDHTAYSNIDNEVINALDSLYGDPGAVTPQKKAQFQAIGGQLSEAINEIREKAPENWDRIRRDPAMQRRLVEAVVRGNLPPQAVKMIEQQKLQNTQMTTGELWAAFNEAKQIEDPAQRGEIRSKIRQQILEDMYSRQRKGR